ncbi:MAG: sigma-70 family RNA polymerase sigma factor [Myxococcales bacterium]|nr:sigma-70 family RNA polymerase sigma factor [Myxococcales bacterium]
MSSAHDLDDDAALAAWREGDRAAGQLLFTRYYQPVARFFINKVGEASPDLIQRTFLACVEGKDKFRGEGSFRSFLFGIAYRQLRRHFEARARDRIDFGSRSVHDLDPNASVLLAALEQQQLLLAALRRIPLELQVVLELFYWEDMRAQDCAEILEIPIGTAKSRLRRAREQLEQALSELDGSPDVLHDTRTRLDDWALQLRAQLGR